MKKYTYNYQIFNTKTKEVYEKGKTPECSSRVAAHNWVFAMALKYPMYDRAIQMRTGTLDIIGGN